MFIFKTKYKSFEILLTLQKCYSYSELMFTITCQGMSAIKYYKLIFITYECAHLWKVLHVYIIEIGNIFDNYICQ